LTLAPVSQDAWQGPSLQNQPARIYLLVGEREKALDRLEPPLQVRYYYLSPGWLKIDPTFTPLRGYSGCRLLRRPLQGASDPRDAQGPVPENLSACEPQHDVSSRLECLDNPVVGFPDKQFAVVAAIAEDDETSVPVAEVWSGRAPYQARAPDELDRDGLLSGELRPKPCPVLFECLVDLCWPFVQLRYAVARGPV